MNSPTKQSTSSIVQIAYNSQQVGEAADFQEGYGV